MGNGPVMTIIRTTDRDSYRTDEGRGRFYYFQGEGPFISVTNAIKLGIPSPYIAPWYAKVVAEYVEENWDSLRFVRENKEPEILTKFLKALPVQRRDAAGEFGTTVHDICEDLILTGLHPPYMDAKIAQRVKQFLAWQEEMKPKYLAVEGIVFNREYGYAGAFDILCDLPGHGKVIIDIKTGKGIYGSAAIQQTAYRHGEFIAVGTDEVPMIETDGAMGHQDRQGRLRVGSDPTDRLSAWRVHSRRD
ncbi:hypothetical protein LCGC14_2417090 [marine sediment metagenome]|uniref:PD-(D/E)XK endonuclease-like domain-containing protein n=1 Tax=marine sediment metagenome TaxID=412755 RepID=A0A0F9BQU2_9ZZZZ